MHYLHTVIFVLKYAACIAIVAGLVVAPVYIGVLNGKDKYNNVLIRLSSWLFGWTGVGWLVGLFWAARGKSF